MNRDEDQEASQVPIIEANTRLEDKTSKHLRLKSHSLQNILGDLQSKVSTRRQLENFCEHHAFVSMVEPSKVFEALEDPDWLLAMQEELNNFKRNDVWTLVKRPDHCRNVIGPSGFSRTSKINTASSSATKQDWWPKAFPKLKAWTMARRLHPWLDLSQSVSFWHLPLTMVSSFNKWM
jgi:hypothetical protein